MSFASTSVVWCGAVWCGVVWCGAVWYRALRINVPATYLCVSGTDMLRQLYVLPH